MKKTLPAIAVAMSLQLSIQAQDFEWSGQLGGAGVEIAYAVAVDANGNVYTTGSFRGTVDFDPGSETFELTATGSNSDIFISKLNASGSFAWAKKIGSAGDDSGYSIAVDAQGNVYTTGWFSGTVDFDPGPLSLNLSSVGGRDIFIAKMDASGNPIWAKRMGDYGADQGNSVAVDAAGNVYVAGTFEWFADFGSFTLTSAGSQDIFISKLNSSGEFVWAKRMGGAGDDLGGFIALDAESNVYITGDFEATADFDPGTDVFELSSSGYGDVDIFIAKLEHSGNFAWAKRMGSPGGSEAGYAIAADNTGNVYTTGRFRATVDFDPGTDVFELTAAGTDDIFICKLNNAGGFVWAKRTGGADNDVGFSIKADAAGNSYTTGYFRGTVDFDPGADAFELTAAGTQDIFISRLNASGDFVWAKQLGGTGGSGSGRSITVDAAGAVYTAGGFSGTMDFNPGAGTYELTAAGNTDVFIHKMGYPVGLNGIEARLNAGVFPNPAHSWLNIQTDETIETVSIYSTLGALVQTENQHTFSIAQLPAGIYLLHIKTAKGIGTARIIKSAL